MKCQCINVKAGADEHGFVPVEIHCESEATQITEDDLPVCDECANLFKAEGFTVTSFAESEGIEPPR